jgi:hypothetical protein
MFIYNLMTYKTRQYKKDIFYLYPDVQHVFMVTFINKLMLTAMCCEKQIFYDFRIYVTCLLIFL